MPLKKLVFKPGVNKENTRYTNEGGWYDCDKIRFRQGTPEKIGGWERVSSNTYLGTARSLWPWSNIAYAAYLGVGTNLKYYIMSGGGYYDITPIRTTTALPASPFTGNGTTTVTVNAPSHGAINGDFVTFSGVTGTYASLLNAEYQITYVNANTYTITTASALPIGTTGGSGVSAAYQINVGPGDAVPITGWGAGAWGGGAWGIGASSTDSLRIWNAQNFGEDLIYGPQRGPLYYWDATATLTSRGVALTSLPGASDVPSTCNLLMVSDTSRFVIALGCPDYGSTTLDPMLIRWSDQENAVNWTPAATNQAGSVRLSHGSRIEAVAQVRQELLVWTDTSLYALQYLGPPVVWGSQLLADNISIASDRAWATAAGVTYWMGDEKFYMHDGRTRTLNCDLRSHIFTDFNFTQAQQVFASTIEQFNEVWWFYCSQNSTVIDRYVVFNYIENVWYYGTMSRTAWIDASVVSNLPIAATSNRLVYHEYGVDDNTTGSPIAINAYISSSEFDIDDGYNFGFVWRILPDVTFRGSTAGSPSATLTLYPMQNSGSGYNTPASLGGTSTGTIVRTATVPIEQFTGQVNVRVRGRQMSMKMESTALGVQWQIGSPRIDIRQDGRKS
jgi:hypothetical protein